MKKNLFFKGVMAEIGSSAGCDFILVSCWSKLRLNIRPLSFQHYAVMVAGYYQKHSTDYQQLVPQSSQAIKHHICVMPVLYG